MVATAFGMIPHAPARAEAYAQVLNSTEVVTSGADARMVERAGVDMKALDRPRPGEIGGRGHQEAPGPGPDHFRDDAEEGQLAGLRFAKIELQQPDILALML